MKQARKDGGRRETLTEVGLEIERVIRTSKLTADEVVRKAHEEAALTLSQARHEAERITNGASDKEREARQEAERIMQEARDMEREARREADRITQAATDQARETIEVLLMTAEAQREEMLEEQKRHAKAVRGYDKELREQITMLKHELAKLNGETPLLVTDAELEDEEPEEQEDASIWTDSEIGGKSVRPVPIHDIGALGG